MVQKRHQIASNLGELELLENALLNKLRIEAKFRIGVKLFGLC
jgi:hypothetical protein